MLITAYAYCEDYTDDEETMKTPYMQVESSKKNENAVNVSEKTQAQEEIKAKSVCIKEDCRSNWPILKCADYDGRPAGETGDEFCGQKNQTCTAVLLGSGQTFFNECSLATNSVHTCRCCWVE